MLYRALCRAPAAFPPLSRGVEEVWRPTWEGPQSCGTSWPWAHSHLLLAPALVVCLMCHGSWSIHGCGQWLGGAEGKSLLSTNRLSFKDKPSPCPFKKLTVNMYLAGNIAAAGCTRSKEGATQGPGGMHTHSWALVIQPGTRLRSSC